MSLLGVAVCAAAFLGSLDVAAADVYSFEFTADTSSSTDASYGHLVVSGELFTSGASLPALVTAISGSVSGAILPIDNGTITGLSPYADSDNFVQATGAGNDDFSFGGLSFVVGAQDFNLYTWNPGTGAGSYALNSAIDAVGYPQNGVVGTLTVTAVPEISTWAMMFLGFAGLGLAGVRQTRDRGSAAPTAA